MQYRGDGQNQGNAFTCSGFRNWKKQYDSVLKHEQSDAHLNAIIAEALFLQQGTIAANFQRQETLESERIKQQVISNRNVMTHIVDAVILLGRQGLPFRGHRESLSNPYQNTGNFLELLKFLSPYDSTIKEHLQKVTTEQQQLAAKCSEKPGPIGPGSRLTFLSNDSQNKLISVIGSETSAEIIRRIKNCRAWSLIADTTPDVTHKEQLSICVRIVDEFGDCSEHLLSCQRASGTSAVALYNVIAAALECYGVTFEKLVAQAYDGASNMSGCYNSLQAIIKEKIGSHVIYVHCYAHTLNLVLADSASVAINVISLFSNLEKLYVLFSKSQKVHELFESVQKSAQLQVFSVKPLNTVRWNAREFCLKIFLLRFDCILQVLQTVAENRSFEENQRATAQGLYSSFQTKKIVATACLFREIFAVTGPLSRYLQSVDVNFGKAIDMVDSSIEKIEKMRDEAEKILQIVETDFEGVHWKTTRICHKRVMDGEQERDQPASTAEG